MSVAAENDRQPKEDIMAEQRTAGHESSGGILRQLADELGITRPTPETYEGADERIREDVCERLWHEPAVDVSDVTVEVKDALVKLEGTVLHRQMKHRIEDIAASCAGVADVDNRIRVGRPGAPHS
jgi:osmotically-inducible protein OsmY